MKKNNKKVLKVTHNTWHGLVLWFSKEFNKEYYEVEVALIEILRNEGVDKIIKEMLEHDIIEICNEPIEKACTMYNVLAFRNEYKTKLETYLINEEFISGLVNVFCNNCGVPKELITGPFLIDENTKEEIKPEIFNHISQEFIKLNKFNKK